MVFFDLGFICYFVYIDEFDWRLEFERCFTRDRGFGMREVRLSTGGSR